MNLGQPTFIRERTFEHRKSNLGYDDLNVETINGSRQYITPSGNKYSSITTVLSIRKRHIIQEWRKRVGNDEANRISRAACSRGTALHTICERYIKNIDPILTGKEMPNVIQMFRAIFPTINTRVGIVYAQESALYSDHLGVAGRVDLVAEFDGILSIIDFKSSSRVKNKEDIHEYFMQESAYAIMFEERTGIPVPRIVTIMGVDGQNKPLIFQEKRDNWTNELHKTISDYKREHIFKNA